MSIEHQAIVLNHSKAKGTARIVLIGLANHASIVNNRCWPSVSRLQRYTGGMDRTSIFRALDRLEELGEIKRMRHGGPAPTFKPEATIRQRPNLYEILLRCPDTCDGTAQHRDRRRPVVPDEMLGDIDEDEVANSDLMHERGGKNDDYEVAPVRPKPSITTNTKKVLNLTIEERQKLNPVSDPWEESRRAKEALLQDPPIECHHGRVAIVCPQCQESKVDPNEN
jgi:hypothetical protein